MLFLSLFFGNVLLAESNNNDFLTDNFGTPTWGHSSGANPHPTNSATFDFECASAVVFDAPTALCSDGVTPLAVSISSDVTTPDPIPCTNDYVRVITYEATDCPAGGAPSNTSQFVITITVADLTAPVAPDDSGANSTVDCLAAATMPAAPGDVIDNCGETISPTGPVAGSDPACEGTKTYTWTYTDCAGNSDTYIYTYTIEYDPFTDPTDGASTVDCPDDTDAVPTPPTVIDNCGVTLTPTGPVDSGKPACEGDRTYTWTYTDCEGNSHDYVYTYTVEYDPFTDPTDGASTVDCPDDTDAVPTPPTVMDNCGVTLTPTGPVDSGKPTCEGDRTYTWTYTDCEGNSHDYVYTYTVEYEDFTVTPATGSMTVDCPDDTDAVPTPPSVMDNCGVTLTPTGPVDSGKPACEGDRTYTWTYTDCEGNSHDYVYTYTVINIPAPSISFPSDPFTSVANAAGNCSNTVGWIAPIVTDNCAGVTLVSAIAEDSRFTPIAISDPEGSPTATLPVGQNNIIYTYMDACGNTTIDSFYIEILDDEAPNVLYPTGVILNYANCNSDVVVPNYGFLTSVDDNCTGYTITQSPAPGTLVSSIATLATGETFTVTITVTDNYPSPTNMGASDNFIVTLNEDNTPVPNLPGAVLDPLSGTCGPMVVDAPYAVDVCGNTICGVPFPLPAGTIDLGPACGAGGGACSNASRDIPLVSIPDGSPAGVNIPIEFTESGIVEEVEIDLNISHTWVGDLRVTLTDPDGNSIRIFDRPGTPPGIFGCPGNDLDVTFTSSGDPASVFESTCNNSPAISGSFQPLDPFTIITNANVNAQGTWVLNISDNAFADQGSTIAGGSLSLCIQDNGSTATPDYLFPVGTHNITWNYDGGNGNIVTQQQVITVEDDNILPTLNCVSDITLELDENGEAFLGAGPIVGESFTLGGLNSTSSQYCFTAGASDVTFSFDWENTVEPEWDDFGYSINGNNTLLTVSAFSGGSAPQSGSETVTVPAGQEFCFLMNNDFIIASTTEIVVLPGLLGDLAIANWTPSATGATYNAVDATDNCGVDFSTLLINDGNTVSFDCSNVGSGNTVSTSIEDINGNTGFCTTNVTIEDNVPPTLSGIPADITVDCNSIPSVEGGVTGDDNCSIVGVVFNETSTQVLNSAICEYYNYQITRTWSVTDVNGNITEDSQVITVEDVQGPIFASNNFPSVVTANASAGSCDAFVSLELTSSGVLDLPGCVNFSDLTITNNGNGTGDADASGTYPVGSTPVTFTVTDPCGNSDSYVVNVNVTDNTAPIAACNNISVGIPDGQDSIIIDPSLIALIDNGSFDNCSPIVDLDVFPNVFYCSQIADGTQSVFDITLAVSVPGSPDTTFCLTTITIQDNNAPNITCVDPVVITLDADGTATATAAMLNGGVDDCSDIMTIELTGNTGFDINDIGSHPISDGITPTLQVTDVHGNVETCTPTTLIVTPPTTCITSADVIDNGQVQIPYTSTNFTNVIGFQFSIEVGDNAVAAFATDNAANLCGGTTINVPNLSGVHQNLICNGTFTNQISVTGDTLSVSWFNTSPDPVSISAGETLFNFRLNALGVVGDMTTFLITGAPYSNELTTKYGNDILTDNPPLCLNPIGTFEVGDNATLPISGNVSTWSKTRIDTIGYDTISMMPLVIDPILDTVILVAGQGLANASMVKIEEMLPLASNTPVTTDTDMTDANGDYTVQVANVLNGVAIDLTPRKNNPNWLNNGDVSSSDLFFIQQHIVNNIPFTSIYDYVASDVNQSGTITTLDLVLIQDVIVNPELAPIPSSVIDAYNPWRFIQREYAEMNLDPFDLDPSISLPSQPMAPVIPAGDQNRVYNPAMLPMTNIDWIAVKVGQVFGNLNTSTLTTNDVDDRTGENFVMSVENQKVRNGELISIPVYAKDYAAFIAWQFTLEFDENYLAYEGMLPGAITGFEENKLGLNSVEEGIIGAVWYGTPNSVKSDEVLFTLQFTALDNADALSGLIEVTSRTVKSESSLMSGATGEVSLAFFSPTVTVATDFELHQNRPNPFNEETLISFNLPEAGFATVTISDISGRTLKVIEGDFAKGYNEVRIQSNHLSSTGVLYYQLESAEHIATKKMIILE